MTQIKQNYCRCFVILILIGALFGCDSLKLNFPDWVGIEDDSMNTDKARVLKEVSTRLIQTDTGIHSAQELELSANNKSSPEKEEILLNAANAYLNLTKFSKVRYLLDKTSQTQLPEFLYLRHQILTAALYIAQNELSEAEKIIEKLEEYTNTDPVFNDWMILTRARLSERRGEFLQSLQLLNNRDSALDSTQETNNLQLIWQLITRQNIQKLEQARFKSTDKLLLGWIELGIINNKREKTPPHQFKQSLSVWNSAYKDHPANPVYRKISGDMFLHVDKQQANTGTTIALLVPVSSAYHDIATAIHDGFTAASAAQNHIVHVYDTGPDLTRIAAKYQLAISKGADIIVGPLGKTAVSHLAQTTQLDKPTILLGTVNNLEDNPILSSQVFEFSLDPDGEAESLAKRAYDRGYSRAAVLYPDSSRGKRLSNTFIKTWLSLGGIITTSVVYKNELYEAEKPIDRLLKSSSISPDVIFMASNSQQGRLLNQVLTTLRPNTTVFATSSIFPGHTDSARDFVLNNVIFSEMPWMIKGFSRAQYYKQQLLKDKNASESSLSRYYAFGVDAYALASRLTEFINHTSTSIDGVTGDIALTENRFTLTLPLVQFVEGIPMPIN